MLLRRIKWRKRFGANTSGNVAVIFAVSLIPMIGFVGIGVDMSRAMAVKTVLDASADAGALAAVTEAMASMTSTNSIYTNNTAFAVLAGIQAGQAMFAADATKIGSVSGGVPTPTVTVTQTGKVLTAVVTYTASSPNAFGPMFGSNSTPVNGSATSSLTLPTFMNITVAIDNSQSMGLAATTPAQTQLQGLTNDSCAFGCHFTDTGMAQSQTNEVTAHNAGIQLRIDVIKSSTQAMINAAAAMPMNGANPYVTFSLATFDNTVTSVASQSANYSNLYNQVGALDLGTDAASGDGDTSTSSITTFLNNTANVPANGTGLSPSSPQQYVFLMTDGVEDTYQATTTACTQSMTSSTITPAFAWNHCTSPFDPSQCTALKNRHVIVGVIYTTYLQMTGDNRWQTLVQPFTNSIASNMQTCASPGWFYQATQGSDITAAVNALFNQATGHGILTQ